MRSILKAGIPILAMASSSVFATTINVDLTDWQSEGAGTWSVASDNNSVYQQTNTALPAVFYETGNNAQGRALSGSIRVEESSDDDFIGFVLGFNANEFSNSDANFWLIDWKQGDQNWSGHSATRGLSLSHVTGAGDFDDFWSHQGEVEEIARGTNLGNTGWQDFVDYDFDIVFTDQLIQVLVNDALELNVSAASLGLSAFEDGAFGFYNFSQSNVRYSALTESDADDIAVPEPSSLGAMLAGVLFIAFRRRQGT